MKMLPRKPGETRGDWIARNEAWFKTPEALASMRAEEASIAEDALAQHAVWARANQVPELYCDLVFGKDLKDTPALLDVKENRSLLQVIVGGAGAGKTTAACWWLRGQQEGDGLFVRASMLSRWERYDMDRMEQLLFPARLVIDDLGGEYVDTKGNFLAILEEVIVDRYENRRRTLITTNMGRDAFVERYDKKIADRLRESGSFFGAGNASLRGSR